MYQKKRHSKRRKQLFRHYFNRAVIVLLLGIIGVALYFALKSDAWDQLNRNISSVSAGALGDSENGDESATVVDPAERDFQDFLDKSTPQRLILRSTDMIDNESDELLVRLERQDKIIRIADSLLQRRNDSRSNDFGTISKLKALRTRELIYFDHGLTTEESIRELQDFAYRSAGASADGEVTEEAQIGKFFARLVRALVFGNVADREEMEPTLLEFKSISQQRVEDADKAREIYDLLGRIHVRVPPALSREFVLEYARIFKSSPSSEVRELAANADKEIIDSEFEFVDVFGSLSVDKEESLDKLSNQIKSYVARPFVSANGYRRLLIQIQVLGAFGRYDVALDCVDLLQRRLAARQALLPLSREASRLKKKYSNAGEKFDFSVVRKVSNDEPFQVRFPEAAVKGVLFFDPSTVNVTTQSVSQIMGIAGRYVPQRDFCLSLIMFDDGTSEQEKSKFRNVEKLLPSVDTGIVDIRTEEGKQFVEKYVLHKRPQFLLLDRDGRIAAVSVLPVDFERRFFDMLRAR